MAKKKFLNENGEQIWPITRIDCIVDNQGKMLSNIIGDLSSLKTNAKKSLVDAINEIVDSNISVPCTSISIMGSDSTLELNVGETGYLSLIVTPSNTTDPVTVKCHNSNMIEAAYNPITKRIDLKGLSAGSAYITAYCGVHKSTCCVTVTADDFIIIDPSGSNERYVININTEYNYMQGGTASSTVTAKSINIVTSLDGTSQSGHAYSYPTNGKDLIDLTAYNILRIKVIYRDHYGNAKVTGFSELNYCFYTDNKFAPDSNMIKVTTFSNSEQEFTLDISNMKGYYHFGIYQEIDIPNTVAKTTSETTYIALEI